MHMAIGAVVNALWDLKAKRAGQPLWQLVSPMTPEELVDLVDFRYLTDALTPEEALDILRRAEPGVRSGPRSCSSAATRRTPPPRAGSATTTRSWSGWAARPSPTASARSSSRSAPTWTTTSDAWASPAREVGPDIQIAIDANQRWDVDDAIAWVRELQPYDLAWIEEPTSPDDLVGHADDPQGPWRRAGGDRGAHRQPGDVQAAAAAGGHRRDADRRRPGGRRQREHRQPAAGRQVRRAGLPARRRGRPVRGRPAPVDDRLRGRQRHLGQPLRRVRRPSARALRRPGPGRSAAATWPRRSRGPAPRCWRRRWPSTATWGADHGRHRPARISPPSPRTGSVCSSTSVCTPWPLGTSGCRTGNGSTPTRTRSTSSTSTRTCSTPADWARQCRRAGHEYAVLTTKHHEGFCLWDTRAHRLQDHQHPVRPRPGRPSSSRPSGPRGIKIGFYHSLIDWHHPDFIIDGFHPLRDETGPGQLNAGRDMARYRAVPPRPGARAAHRLRRDQLPVLRLLLPEPGCTRRSTTTRAREDWGSTELMALTRQLQPGIVINDRLDLPGDLVTPEQYQPSGPMTAATASWWRGRRARRSTAAGATTATTR